MHYILRVLMIIPLLLLVGCKSSQEKSATELRYDGLLRKLQRSVEEISSNNTAGGTVAAYVLACRRLSLLSGADPTPFCSNPVLSTVPAYDLDAQVDQERAAIAAYATDDDRKALLPGAARQVAAAPSALLAQVVVRHWTWSEELNTKILQFYGAAKASVRDDLPPDFPLFSLSNANQKALASHLEREKALIEVSRVSGKDEAIERTVADIDSWLERLRQSQITASQGSAVRSKLVQSADNNAWDTALTDGTTFTRAPDLTVFKANLQSPANPAFEKFMRQASTLDKLRAIAQEPVSAASDPPLGLEASAILVDDCRSLLVLDQAKADEICGAILPALRAALDVVDKSSDDRRWSRTVPDSEIDDAGALTAKALPQAIKQRLLGKAAPLLPSAENARDVDALVERIGKVSRLHAQASAHGYFSALASLEARLDLLHEALRVAADGTLPDALREPFALLSPPAPQSALDDAKRLKWIIEHNLNILPDAIELQIARDALAERIGRLEKTIANPPTRTDFAAAVRSVDPDKAGALLDEASSKATSLAHTKMKDWADKFGAIPGGFETWRGPRGPPPPDPKFPRSGRVLAALKTMGGNPTEAVNAFAALKAEHAEFYLRLPPPPNDLTEAWEFGRKDVRAWMASLLSPEDLASTKIYLRDAANRIPDFFKYADDWRDLSDGIDAAMRAITAEATLRVQTGSGHPPGYPPGRPPSVAAVAESYAPELDKRVVGSAEKQMRLQTAKSVYPDPTRMPAALREEVKDIANSILDQEVKRLDGVFAALRGVNGQGGLLDHAARSVDKLSTSELDALEELKATAIRAAEIVARRIESVEVDRLAPPDRDRWGRVETWFRGFGDAPATAPADPPLPLTPLRSGGANFLFADAELERTFVDLSASLERADASLRAAKSIAIRPVEFGPLGETKGRAVLKRSQWSGDRFSFDEMAKGVSASERRYPAELRDWKGFFKRETPAEQAVREAANATPKPYDFERDVKHGANTKGMGGGVHFGETAKPQPNASALVTSGGLLSYDDASQAIELKLAGTVYRYGPIAPRVVKALFSYVTAYPGINLAVTIGATGDIALAGSADESPVLLDPHFVDNPVGQSLYLADILPWSLDSPKLPNGGDNPARADFRDANVAFDNEVKAQNEKIGILVKPVVPLSQLNRDNVRDMLSGHPQAARLIAIIQSTTAEEFWSIYVSETVDKEIRSRQFLVGLHKVLSDIRMLSGQLKSNRYDLEELKLKLSLGALDPDERRLSELILLYIEAGEQKVTSTLIDQYRQRYGEMARNHAEKAFDPSEIERLNQMGSRNQRALHAVSKGAELDRRAGEMRFSKGVMRLLAAVIADSRPELDDEARAAYIRKLVTGRLCSATSLATLFDDNVTFDLVDGRILISTAMRYRYVQASLQVRSNEFVCELDVIDKDLPTKITDIVQLETAANSNVDALASAYPPLHDVREYAGFAAFLRWAACPESVEGRCRRRPGLSIDFSALGRYELRDKIATPTPDAEKRP